MNKITITQNKNIGYFRVTSDMPDKIFNHLSGLGFTCVKFDSSSQFFEDYIKPIVTREGFDYEICQLSERVINTDWLISDFIDSSLIPTNFWEELRSAGKTDEQIWEFISPALESYEGSIYVDILGINKEKVICELKQMGDVDVL